MIYRLRSLIFDFFFYTFTTIYLIFFLPFAIVCPRSFVFILFRTWTRICLKMLSLIVGLHYTVRGREHLKAATANGACIIACKHQSAFDTIFISLYLNDIVIILKGQLAYVPFFGYYLKKLGSIFIDRENKTGAIRDLIKKCHAAVSINRSLFIFPEGTRSKPGESVPYQRGISLLYRDLNIPVVPVALNTGVFWGRKSVFKRPGEIIIDIQPAILPGLERNQFMDTLQGTIETASSNLLNTTTKPKKNWFKRLVTLILGLSIVTGFSLYVGTKILIDQNLNAAGISFTESKFSIGIHSLPAYELTNASLNSPALPGSVIMARTARLTVTGWNKFTLQAENIHMQLHGNIFTSLNELEVFIVHHTNSLSMPYIRAQHVNINIGSFSSTLNKLEGNYKQTEHTLEFSFDTPRPAAIDTPIILLKGAIARKDQRFKGQIAAQTTFGEPFIDALQQQNMVTTTQASDLKKSLLPIPHESNQNLKQMIIPIED